MKRTLHNVSSIGLTQADLDSLCALFASYGDIESVVLYGSRAKGNFKPFSDLDIVLVGDNLTNSVLNRVIVDIDDLMLPYSFDVSIYSILSNPNLKEHIRRVGIALYSRSSS